MSKKSLLLCRCPRHSVCGSGGRLLRSTFRNCWMRFLIVWPNSLPTALGGGQTRSVLRSQLPECRQLNSVRFAVFRFYVRSRWQQSKIPLSSGTGSPFRSARALDKLSANRPTGIAAALERRKAATNWSPMTIGLGRNRSQYPRSVARFLAGTDGSRLHLFTGVLQPLRNPLASRSYLSREVSPSGSPGFRCHYSS